MKRIITLVLPAFLLLVFSQCKKNGGSDKPKKAIVTTIAGTGEQGYLDATAAFAKFKIPYDVAVQSDGTLFITDTYNYRVRKLATNGIVYTVAGTGSPGKTNGNVSAASFELAMRLAVNASGDLYTLDLANYQVRKITAGINVSAFGNGYPNGFADGPVDMAEFGWCEGIAVAGNGDVYIADASNSRIRKIANGNVSTVAGSDLEGYLDGPVTQAQFRLPAGIAFDKQGNLYVCDAGNYRIRKITPAGIVSTVAGSGIPGFEDGNAGTARFYTLGDIVVDNKGNLYVTDIYAIRKITPAGDVTTIAGLTPGYVDGEGSIARFRIPTGLAIDGTGNIYVADAGDNRIRKISFQ